MSELVGIPTVTIRAWESRHRIVEPQRTEGGHRLYSEADVETLRWVKRQLEEHHLKISEAAQLLKVKQRERPLPSAAEEAAARPDRRADLIDRLYESLVALDSAHANETIDLAFSLYGFEDVFHRILTPVLYRIGTEWENRTVSVAQEHFATELILNRFHQVLRVLPVDRRYARALAFCPEGELHQMGLLLFSLFLRGKGIDVVYLGPNTPYEGLLRLIASYDISIVAISVSEPGLIPGLERWLAECSERVPGITFALGGRGFHAAPATLRPSLLGGGPDVWEQWFRSVPALR